MTDKNCFIFDVDGTLYSKRKMHFQMACKLIGFSFFHMKRVKELFYIYVFRKYREKEMYQSLSVEQIMQVISAKRNWEKEELQRAINYWMFQVPLEILKKCSYPQVLDFIRQKKMKGSTIVIYSDYPAVDKLKVLDVEYDYLFTSEDEGIKGQKPNERGMKYIVSQIGFSGKEILYVGDRNKKDGASARLIDAEYMDILVFKEQILNDK